jgi:NAD-dependent deacetylase
MVGTSIKERWQQALQAKPNPGHLALANLKIGFRITFISKLRMRMDFIPQQEINELLRCMVSLHTWFLHPLPYSFSTKDINLEEDILYALKCKGMLRPDIVWFGEVPYHLDKIDALLHNCDVFM